MSEKSVAIVILNYNNADEIIQYIKQLDKQKNVFLQFVVVDNCSPDQSFEKLEKYYSGYENVHVLKTEKNGGYGYGNNWGIRYTDDLDCEYIVISNSDIIIEDDCLIHKLIESYNKVSEIAFASPLMLLNGKKAYLPAWKLPTVLFDLLSCDFILQRVAARLVKYSLPENSGQYQVDCLPGSFFMGKRSVFLDDLLFDERAFLYGEENILAFKVKSKGLKNYLVTSIEFNHLDSGTISNNYKKYEMFDILFDSKKVYYKYYSDKKFMLPILSMGKIWMKTEIRIIFGLKKLFRWWK